jgi:hypothetical protein
MMSFLVKLVPPLSASCDSIAASIAAADPRMGCRKVSLW